jgi:hypothetical protein
MTVATVECELIPEISIRRNISRDSWIELGHDLAQSATTYRFHIGDWLAHGIDNLKATYEEASEITGYAISTLGSLEYVARRTPKHLRYEGIPWTHFLQLAPLTDSQTERALAWMVENGPSEKVLRAFLIKTFPNKKRRTAANDRRKKFVENANKKAKAKPQPELTATPGAVTVEVEFGHGNNTRTVRKKFSTQPQAAAYLAGIDDGCAWTTYSINAILNGRTKILQGAEYSDIISALQNG